MDAINAIESSMTAKRRETVNIEAVSSPFFNFVRAKPCFTVWSFSLIRKTELWKTNKPPAVRVVEVASAYSIKPPVL